MRNSTFCLCRKSFLILVKVFFSLLLVLFLLIDSSAQTSVSTGYPSTTFIVGGSPVIVAPSLTVSASGTITDVKVSIETIVAGDVIDATVPSGYSKTWNSTTKTLTITTNGGSGSASDYQTMLRSVTFSTTSTSSPRRINFIMANVVSLVVESKEHVYELVYSSSSITWIAAKTAADAKTITTETGTEHGYLATITSPAENNFVAAKVSANTWLGASDDNAYTSSYSGYGEGEWFWVEGPEAGQKFWTGGQYGSFYNNMFEAWYKGEPEPNNAGNENFMHMYGTGGQAGTWNDFANNNTSVHYYLVEYGGYPTSPTTIVASDYADITITTNTPPVANNDTYTRFYTDTNISFTVPANGVLGNDTDADGNSLTVGTPRPASGPSHGTLTLNSNGSFTYTSTNGYKDQTDAFTYYAYDGTVNSSSPATVTIYIYTPRFTNGGGNGLFSNPANWNCGYVPNESLNIVIAAGQTMVVNQNYTCKNLKFETGASFYCTNGSTLTITGDVQKSTGATAIDVNSSIQVKSSLQIQNQ